jgi:hypothetical protein
MRPRNKEEFSISEIRMYPTYVFLIYFCFSVLIYLSLKCNHFNNWHRQISQIGGICFIFFNVHSTLKRISKQQTGLLLTIKLNHKSKTPLTQQNFPNISIKMGSRTANCRCLFACKYTLTHLEQELKHYSSTACIIWHHQGKM